ncbi:hypothetical protein MKX01_037638 [Papaver californicum]|nr:hypothetical protein MKX01_037638 [Papaver californicum]
MDVDVRKIIECKDVEILDVINNKYQKLEVNEVTQYQKVEVKVGAKFDKIKQKTGIGAHQIFMHCMVVVVQADVYEQLTFNEIDV